MPAFFLPFPAAIHDHQSLNAKALADMGAAKVFQEKDLNSQEVVSEIFKVFDSQDKLSDMSRKMASSARKDAASLLVDQLESLAEKNRSEHKN